MSGAAGAAAGRPGGAWSARGRSTRALARAGALVAVLALVGAGCDGDDGGPARDADGTLRIGVLLPPAGTLDDLAPPVRAGAALAVSEITAAGAPAELVVEAVELTEVPGTPMADQVDAWLAQGVDVVVGPLAGGSLGVLGGELADAGIVACTPSAAEIVDTGSWIFRTSATDAHQAVLLADEILVAGRQRVAVVRTPGGGGEALADRVVAELAARGVDALGPLGLAADGSDAADVAARVAGGEVDGLVLVTVPEPGIAVLDALSSAGLPPSTLPTWATGGLLVPDLGTRVEPAVVAGLQGVAPAAAPESPAFLAALRAVDPGVAPWYAAQAHDCVVVAALAAASAQGDDPDELRAAIGAVVGGGQVCDGYAACLPLVVQGVDVDLEGAAGPLDLDGAGQPRAAAVDRWEVRPDGSLVVVAQPIVTLVDPDASTSTTGASTTAAIGQVSTSSGSATTASSDPAATTASSAAASAAR